MKLMKMYNVIIPVIMFLAFAAASTAVSAQADWTHLGEKDVSFDIEHDTITADDDDLRIRELRIFVDKAPIRFNRVVLVYKDGIRQELEFLEDVQVGKYSRSLTLEGDGHIIKSIEFWYETAPTSGKTARITVYGRS